MEDKPKDYDVYFLGQNPFKEYVKLRLDLIEAKIDLLLTFQEKC